MVVVDLNLNAGGGRVASFVHLAAHLDLVETWGEKSGLDWAPRRGSRGVLYALLNATPRTFVEIGCVQSFDLWVQGERAIDSADEERR